MNEQYIYAMDYPRLHILLASGGAKNIEIQVRYIGVMVAFSYVEK